MTRFSCVYQHYCDARYVAFMASRVIENFIVWSSALFRLTTNKTPNIQYCTLVRGILRSLVDSPHKGLEMLEAFLCDDVIMKSSGDDNFSGILVVFRSAHTWLLFSTDVNPSLATPPLYFNCGLAKLWFAPSVEYAIESQWIRQSIKGKSWVFFTDDVK